jgi:hypothetical protein
MLSRKSKFNNQIFRITQGSPHIVKTGRLDLRTKWGKIWETSKNRSNFNVSFPTTACSPTFHKTNVQHNDLKKDAINEWNKILNIKPCMGQISGTWEPLLCEYWRKSMIIGEKNTDLKRLTPRATKTSLFGRNWAISLKPRLISHPLRLVWWSLITVKPV